MRLFDSHCHLDMEEFRGDLDGVLSRAKASGVCRALLAACDEASSADVVRISGEKSGFGVELWASAGIHPHEADSAARSLPDSLPRLSERREVVAIGEIGLDYYYDNSPRDVQKDVFERQLEWAGRAKKPILVHLRNAKDRASGDAYSDAMSMIKNHPDLSGGVIHCFSGDVADARAALDLGFYVSFAGPVTYPSAATLREAAVFAPLDRILCETDSPYL
ncbi:MAG: TatD family hydrolase, partial [Synergistaceae bacterium]|nr:TatD family hydrolase [Synergistaceae bacterium]